MDNNITNLDLSPDIIRIWTFNLITSNREAVTFLLP